MLGVITTTALYVDKTVDSFVSAIQRLEFSDTDLRQQELQAITLQWNKEKDIIQASISHTKIDTVTDLLASLIIYEEQGNRTEYKKTALLLCNAFEELRLLEKINVTNIL